MTDCYKTASDSSALARILISLCLAVLLAGLFACDKSPKMVEENSELDIAAGMNKKAVKLFELEMYAEAEKSETTGDGSEY